MMMTNKTARTVLAETVDKVRAVSQELAKVPLPPRDVVSGERMVGAQRTLGAACGGLEWLLSGGRLEAMVAPDVPASPPGIGAEVRRALDILLTAQASRETCAARGNAVGEETEQIEVGEPLIELESILRRVATRCAEAERATVDTTPAAEDCPRDVVREEAERAARALRTSLEDASYNRGYLAGTEKAFEVAGLMCPTCKAGVARGRCISCNVEVGR